MDMVINTVVAFAALPTVYHENHVSSVMNREKLEKFTCDTVRLYGCFIDNLFSFVWVNDKFGKGGKWRFWSSTLCSNYCCLF